MVIAIGWEVMANQHAAARSEREPFDVLVLRSVDRLDIGRFRRRLPVANGHAGNLGGCCHIRFQQRGRNRQRTSDVVVFFLPSRTILRAESSGGNSGDVNPQDSREDHAERWRIRCGSSDEEDNRSRIRGARITAF